MCLDVVRKKVFPEEAEQIGWKILQQVPKRDTWKPKYGVYRFPQRPIRGLLRLGETYISKDTKMIGSGIFEAGEKYPVGFHIYLKKPRTKRFNHTVVKVHFANVVARGFQDRRRVVVAKEMTLLEEH